jgi:hypothetical protein
MACQMFGLRSQSVGLEQAQLIGVFGMDPRTAQKQVPSLQRFNRPKDHLAAKNDHLSDLRSVCERIGLYYVQFKVP